MKRLLLCLLVGCGSSTVPEQHPPPDLGIVEPDTAPEPALVPRRTMKMVPLFGGTSVHNLMIDTSFEGGSYGIGRWYANLGASLSLDGPSLGQRILSDAPESAVLPVGTIADIPEKGAPRLFTLIAQVPGGTGPFVVSLWMATETPTDVDWGSVVRVSLANAKSSGLSGVEILRKESRVIAGRVWHRYQGEVSTTLSMGAYFVIRFRPSRVRWYLQAPEVVPKKLFTGDPRMLAGRAFELDEGERAAIAAYQRLPRVQGVPTSASNPPR